MRTLLALALVAALIYAVAWVLRRVRGEKVPLKAAKGRGPLRAEATLTLAPQRAVHVVRAGREVLVLGVAEHQVSLLRSLSEEDALELGLIEPAADEAPVVQRLPDLRAGRALRASALPTGALVARLREMTVRS